MDPNTVILVVLSMAIGSVIPILMTEFVRYFKRREKSNKEDVEFTIKTGQEIIEISTVIEEYELTQRFPKRAKTQILFLDPFFEAKVILNMNPRFFAHLRRFSSLIGEF